LRKLLLLILSAGFLQLLHGQVNYWQQRADFTIDVSLDDKNHTLDGFETIRYTNNSPDTLHFIWFHLWPNAYKNDKTAFTDQQIENGNTDFYFSGKADRGYINRLDFKVNNQTATLEDHPQHTDITKLILPHPLAPGGTITIATPFHVQLPFNFSRGGHDGQSYQVTQWFPKPAVYDANGWHPMPYLDQGEFYSEFGTFNVSITLPANYVVGATGIVTETTEQQWLQARKTFSWEPQKQKEKDKNGQVKTSYQVFPASAVTNKTLHYTQDNIHDFAWFADKRFIVDHDTCQLASGKIIDVYTYYTPAEKKLWQQSLQYCKDAVRFYSTRIGEYPFPVVQAVQGPQSFGGGMEYPTITVIAPAADPRSLDITIAHEIGHNWFYGILASNERTHPWMDEGINSYYEQAYEAWKYPKTDHQLEQGLLEWLVQEKKDQPIATTSTQFTATNYAEIAYYKTSQWMKWLERYLGHETFEKAMQAFYSKWQFKHPRPDDFKITLENTSERNLDSVFRQLQKKGNLPGPAKTGIALQGPRELINGKHAAKNSAITLLPAIGANSYDKLMVGLVVTNMRLQPNKFRFLLAPLYATGSKSFNGIGLVNYSIIPGKWIQKVDIGISAARFSNNLFKAEDGTKTFLSFTKIAPGIRFTLGNKNPRSQLLRYIQFRHFLFREDNFTFTRDSIVTPGGTTYFSRAGSTSENRNLSQAILHWENTRVLYPWSGELKTELGDGFVRTAFTGKYFFNYPAGGGLQVRLFAGKFFYTGSKTITRQFETDRYHLNMTGANGYEDYTYSDYFIGRNKFEGLPSQQIMERDGALRMRTDLLADKVGKTDNWLAAANFSTSIPKAINPLSVLPIKIPLHLFFDIGTYAEAWEQGSDADRFLYDFGLQIPLLNKTVNIYIPLLYSKVYKDYLLSTIEKKERFLKKISFSIDLSGFSFRKIGRNNML